MVWSGGGAHSISMSKVAAELFSNLVNAPDWSALWWLKWVGVGAIVFMLLWCAMIIVMGVWFPHLLMPLR